MSCWDCRFNFPEGCAMRMPSFETYEPCGKFSAAEYEPGSDSGEVAASYTVADALMNIFGFVRKE